MPVSAVPLIDLAPARAGGAAGRRAVAAAIGGACETIGFLVVTGHGVPAAVADAAAATARAFFDLPLEAKLACRPPPGIMRGYAPIGGESVTYSIGSAAPPDLNESFAIGPLTAPAGDGSAHFAANIWPAAPAALRDAWSAYYRAMEGLAATLMQLFALALALDETFFDDKIDRHISRLRVRNYPDQATSPLPGQLRAGAHTDHGSLTILRTEDRPGGLQVAGPGDTWLDVPHVPDSFVVNLGDLMARWTNDRWVSTLHRVVNPPAARAGDSRRQSLVFFHNPNHDTLVECLPSCRGAGAKYPPVTSGEHLRRQFDRMQLGDDAARP